jgi:hypothetical protein
MLTKAKKILFRGFTVCAQGLFAEENGDGICTTHVSAKRTGPDHVLAIDGAPTPPEKFIKAAATDCLVTTREIGTRHRTPVVGAQGMHTDRTVSGSVVIPEIMHRDADFDDGFAGSLCFCAH